MADRQASICEEKGFDLVGSGLDLDGV